MHASPHLPGPWRSNKACDIRFIIVIPSPTVHRAARSSSPANTLGRSTTCVRRDGTVSVDGLGLDVAMALHSSGYAKVAVLPVPHAGSADIMASLDALTVPYLPVHVAATGTAAGSHRPGDTDVSHHFTLTRDETTRLTAAALEQSRPGDWIIWCGDLPEGFGIADLAAAVHVSRRDGRHVGLDLTGHASTQYIARLLTDPTESAPDRIRSSVHDIPRRAVPSGLHPRALQRISRALREAGTCVVLTDEGTVVIDDHATSCVCRPAHLLAAV